MTSKPKSSSRERGGERSCRWWLRSPRSCAPPAASIPGAEDECSSGQEELRGGSFCAQQEVALLPFLPKSSFRKMALCSLFLVTLCLCPVSCSSPLSGTAKLSKVSFPSSWCLVVHRGRVETPRGLPGGSLLSFSRHRLHHPFPGGTKAQPLSSYQPLCTALHFLALRSVYWGPGKSQGSHGTFPGGDAGVRGWNAGRSQKVWVGGWRDEQSSGVSLAQTPKNAWQDKCFLEEPHLTIVTFFTFVIYVFIRSSKYWYLLLKGSMWCFAVELVFRFL